MATRTTTTAHLGHVSSTCRAVSCLLMGLALPTVADAQPDRGMGLQSPPPAISQPSTEPFEVRALVIGNDDYVADGAALQNAVADARLVAAALRAREIADVREGYNLSRVDMVAAVHDFRDALGPSDVAIFYYAGHGIEIENNNYLLPVEFRETSGRRAATSAVNTDDILSILEGDRDGGINVIILDACRNDPFTRSRSWNPVIRGTGQSAGLADVALRTPDRRRARHTAFMFATSPGEPAADQVEGEANGPYATAFARVLLRGGPSSSLALISFQQDVAQEMDQLRGDAQTPSFFTQIVRDVYFLPAQLWPTDTSSSTRLEPAAIPTEPRAASGGRGGFVGGGIALAGTVGAAVWAADRGRAADACMSCVNPDQLERQRRAAVGVTMMLAATGVVLVVVGGVVRRRHPVRRTQASVACGVMGAGALCTVRF